MRSTTCLATGNSSCELMSTSAACLHRQKYVYCFLCSGIASGHVCDQRRAIFVLALCKRLFDVLHDAIRSFKDVRSKGNSGRGGFFVCVSLRENDSRSEFRVQM